MSNNTQSRGLGDTIAAITKWFGIQPCGGCERRREVLNQWLPYRRRALEPATEAPMVQLPARGLIVRPRQRLIRPGFEAERGLRPGSILASSGGWREPGRQSGPADWEGGRRQRREAGSSPSTGSSGTGGVPASFACGIDVTDETKNAITTTRTEFGKLNDDEKHDACSALSSLSTGAYAWDIIDLHSQVTSDVLNKPFRPVCATSGTKPACGSSVTVDGSCHFAGSANYVIFGVMCKLCLTYYKSMLGSASWYEVFDKDKYRNGILQFDKAGMLSLIDLYKKYIPLLKGDTPAGNLDAAKRWSIAGFDGWPNGVATPPADRSNCTLTCPHAATGPFSVSWYPFLNAYSR